jgi:hypothetical protein
MTASTIAGIDGVFADVVTTLSGFVGAMPGTMVSVTCRSA